MITYLKIQGEKHAEALEALRNLSIDMPEVCVMDKALFSGLKDTYPLERGGFIYEPQQSMMNLDEGILTLFRGRERVGHLKCHQVLSQKGHALGEYDFFFEWVDKPSNEQLSELKSQIDKVLKPLNVKYEITSKES